MHVNITTLLQLIWELNRSQVHSFRRYGYDTHAASGKITISNIEFLAHGKETRRWLVVVCPFIRFRIGSSAGYRDRNDTCTHPPIDVIARSGVYCCSIQPGSPPSSALLAFCNVRMLAAFLCDVILLCYLSQKQLGFMNPFHFLIV